MEQSPLITTDYRKWLAFNDELTNHQHVSDLCNAVKNISTSGIYTCILVNDERGNRYSIKSTSAGILEIRLEEKDALVAYLKKHYTVDTSSSSTKEIGIDNIKNSKDIGIYSLPKDPAPVTNSFFISTNIVLHAIGYALVGFIIMQLFAIPQLMGIKFPAYITWIFLVMLSAVCHIAVKNYKNHFHSDGIRYRIVAKITIAIFGLVFSGLSIEILLYLLLSTQENYGSIVIVFIASMVIFSGVMGGWIISPFIYFLNKKKSSK